MTPVLFAVFIALQVAAHLLFKFGSVHPERFLWSFVGGNLVGVGSIWFIMLIYQRMNANIVQAMASGAVFVILQIALALLFDSRLNVLQWGGVALILVGIMIAALGGDGVRAGP